MAFRISAAASSLEFYGRISDGRPLLLGMPPRERGGCLWLFGSILPSFRRFSSCLGVSSSGCARTPLLVGRRRKRRSMTVCFVMATDDEEEQGEIYEGQNGRELEADLLVADANLISEAETRAADRQKRKRSERHTYLVAAVMSTLGITSMAVAAVYYRFSWQMEGGEVPVAEMLGTFALSVGAAVGMEFWARWAHRALWHASLWHMHESHHRPRDGPFELNDVFAIINAVPAIALLSFGFFHGGILPGLCFGAGLGITLFGMAYMFVHDGLVHRRFPVGPIADVPYFRRVAAAHQIHHADKFDGVPYGLFMGPRELEEVGGMEELEKEINRRLKLYNSTSSDSSGSSSRN